MGEPMSCLGQKGTPSELLIEAPELEPSHSRSLLLARRIFLSIRIRLTLMMTRGRNTELENEGLLPFGASLVNRSAPLLSPSRRLEDLSSMSSPRSVGIGQLSSRFAVWVSSSLCEIVRVVAAPTHDHFIAASSLPAVVALERLTSNL